MAQKYVTKSLQKFIPLDALKDWIEYKKIGPFTSTEHMNGYRDGLDNLLADIAEGRLETKLFIDDSDSEIL